MGTLWNSVESVVVIFLLIGAGLLVARLGWVSRDGAKVFSKIVINLAVPGTLIHSLSTNIARQQLLESWLPILVVFIATPSAFLVGRLFAVVLRIPKERRGVFTVLFALSNSVFIGFPVIQALFGDAGMPYAVFFYLGNTTVFWLAGYLAIRRDADVILGRQSRISAGGVARKLVTPPIIAIVAMFAVVAAGLELPAVVVKTAGFLGGMTTPLSLIFTGCMVFFLGFRGLRLEKGMIAVLLGRFVLIPALFFGACVLAIALAPTQGAGVNLYLMRDVFTVQTALPAMMQTTILAELYGADVKYATKNVLLTTLICLITIPAYVFLLPLI